MQENQDLVPDSIWASAPAEKTHPKLCGISEISGGWLQLGYKWLLKKAGQINPDQETKFKILPLTVKQSNKSND